MRIRYIDKFLIFLFFVCAIFAQAQDIPKPMSPPRLVNDFANIFTSGERENLEKLLLNYNDTTSTQIYVVTVDDLQGYAASDYAFQLGEQWGVGQKGKDNGVVILIKPKKGNSRGDVFIAVGYGLEPYLNDARIGRIIDNYMLPYFKQDDYYNGVLAASISIMKYLSGQFQADPDSGMPKATDIIIGLILLILFVYFISKADRNNKNKGNRSSRGGGFPPIIGGGFGGSSGGGFGGSSGRGFGGGGGGRFGGGGAGRSW